MKKIAILSLTAIILITCVCSCASQKNDMPTEVQIKNICELASLECYYNNVARIDKKAEHIFEKDRKQWIEYEGVATIGIDMDKVSMTISGEDITITMPKAQIIRELDLKADSMSYTTSKDGFLNKNKITIEDQKDAIEEAQEKMREEVESNTALFVQAEEDAKKLIENYINTMGEIAGKEYNIIWKQFPQGK